MQKRYKQFAKNECGLCFFPELNTEIEIDLNFVEYIIPEFFDINPNYIIKKDKEYILFMQKDNYINYIKNIQKIIYF